MVIDEQAGFVLRATTGYVFCTVPARGRWVGWIERPRPRIDVRANLDITTSTHAAARVEIAARILSVLEAVTNRDLMA